ncbi:hypothetical protein F5Y09DRAFT_345382 [Xylaria sp. FL1042]|nr:hypothetical protein F5Y09DRAFT_345382 [Xylaria sp. FL1042]
MKNLVSRNMLSSSLFGLTSLFAGATSLNLNVTAIGAKDGSSTLECWQIDNPFDNPTQPGLLGTAQLLLGATSSLSYSIAPPNFDRGLHNAPQKQWVVFLTGVAHITLPDDNTTDAFIIGGPFGLIFAADTDDVSTKGHRTQHIGLTETILFEMPTADGEVPQYHVLHMGPCDAGEIAGIREYGLSAES